MKFMIELLEPMSENHKPMIVFFKYEFKVQTFVCNSKIYVCRHIVHLACHNPSLSSVYNLEARLDSV